MAQSSKSEPSAIFHFLYNKDMSSKRRKIVIAGSATFYKEAKEYKRRFEKKGYRVLACTERADAPRGWHEIYRISTTASVRLTIFLSST